MMQGNVVYMKKSQLPDYNRLSRQLKFVRIIAWFLKKCILSRQLQSVSHSNYYRRQKPKGQRLYASIPQSVRPVTVITRVFNKDQHTKDDHNKAGQRRAHKMQSIMEKLKKTHKKWQKKHREDKQGRPCQMRWETTTP